MPLLLATGPVQERNRDVNDPAAGAHTPLTRRPRGRSRLGSACPCGPADGEQIERADRVDVTPSDRAAVPTGEPSSCRTMSPGSRPELDGVRVQVPLWMLGLRNSQ